MEVSYLESLPPEIITRILLDLPYTEILDFSALALKNHSARCNLKLCSLSRRLSEFCSSWSFWADKLFIDIGIPREEFMKRHRGYPENPHRKYLIKYIDHLRFELANASEEGNLPELQKIVNQSIPFIQNTYMRYGFTNAVIEAHNGPRGTRRKIIKYLINIAYEYPILLPYILYGFVGTKNYRQLRNILYRKSTLTNEDLNEALKVAVETHDLGLIKFLLEEKFPNGIHIDNIQKALVESAIHNDLPIAEYLIQHRVGTINRDQVFKDINRISSELSGRYIPLSNGTTRFLENALVER